MNLKKITRKKLRGIIKGLVGQNPLDEEQKEIVQMIKEAV